MGRINVTAEHIASLKPMEVVKDDLVRQRFTDIYGTLWGEEQAEAAYEREAIHFNRILADSDKLKACTVTSIFIAFIDIAVCGLSVEPGIRAQAYLQPRGHKTGRKYQNGKDEYEYRCTLTISGYGELIQRTRAGQIRYADNPVVVYEGDEFSFTDHDGRKSVRYTLNLDHNPQHPVACFMRITRADGSPDYGVMLEEDWLRLAGYSAKANRYWDDRAKKWVENPNALYLSGDGNRIDTGFLVAKCIKHAFKTYPKVRVGRGTTYEADEKPGRDDDYYGISEAAPAGASADDAGEAEKERPAESFAPASDTSAGVTVDPAAEPASDDDVF